MSPRRIDYFDRARGLGLLAVIVGHIIPVYGSNLQYVNDLLYSFHLPLFFIISGYFFKYEYSIREFLHKKFVNYVIPYISCSLVIIVYWTVTRVLDHGVTGLGNYITVMARGFVVQRRFTVLWFLASLVVAELLLYMLFQFNNSLKFVAAISVVLSVLFLVYSEKGLPILPWNIETSCIILPFLVFGYALRKLRFFEMQKIANTSLIILLLIAGSLILFYNSLFGGDGLELYARHYSFFPLTFTAAIVLSLFMIMVMMNVKSRALSWLGKNTIVFFAFHQSIALDIVNRLINPIAFPNSSITMQTLAVAVSLITVLFICFVMSQAINYLHLNRYFGKRALT